MITRSLVLIVLAGCSKEPVISDILPDTDPDTDVVVVDTDVPEDTDVSAPGAMWETCDDRRPCAEGLVCEHDGTSSDGVCLADSGTPCFDDNWCADSRGYVCLPLASHHDEQVCGPRSLEGRPCFEDDDCGSDRCGEASETCAAALGTSCLSDGDCLDGGVCRFEGDGTRACQLPADVGEYCDTDRDCDDGRTCRSGVCLARAGEEGCGDDAVCPDGTVCRPEGGTTVCDEPAESPGSACSEPGDCGTALVCLDSVCLGADGAECGSSADCSDGNVCWSGYCTLPAAEGDLCQDGSGLPDDSICSDGLLCSAATLTCALPFSGVVGDRCVSDDECGTDSGNTLLCNTYTSTCALPGKTIAAFATTDVASGIAGGDSWGEWTCVDYPEVDVPTGYETWTFVDTVSHHTYGEDTAQFLIVLDDASRKACAIAKGQKDGLFSDGANSQVDFQVNTLVYNPTLMAVDRHDYRAPDCPALPRELPEGIVAEAPCQTATEYYYPATVPEGFEAIGLITLQGYVPEGDFGSFVQTVVGVSEMKISEDYVGIAIDRTMLFAGSYDSMCGGYVSVGWNTVRWRTGLPAEARAGRYHARQPGGEITLDYTDLGDSDNVHLSFLGVQSNNLDTTELPDDQFWNWCGSFSESGISCDLQPSDEESQAFPGENEIEKTLGEAAEDGIVDVCKGLGPPFNLCDVAGLGVKKIVEMIFDALFPDPCGDGNDKDADWTLSKEQIGSGWAYTYDSTTGEDSLNSDVGITVDTVDLNVDD